MTEVDMTQNWKCVSTIWRRLSCSQQSNGADRTSLHIDMQSVELTLTDSDVVSDENRRRQVFHILSRSLTVMCKRRSSSLQSNIARSAAEPTWFWPAAAAVSHSSPRLLLNRRRIGLILRSGYRKTRITIDRFWAGQYFSTRRC